MTEAIVIGGGQAGLAAAYALRRNGLRPVVLEAGPEPVGSWPRYYDSLTLFSPAGYSSLPGKAFPGDRRRYPGRDEVVAYLREYADFVEAEVRTGQRVESVRREGGEYVVRARDEFTAPLVVVATGGFGRPHRPALPGLDSFRGKVLHASEYREPGPFAGQRIVIVGAGNTAVQIGAELADVATVTLATRKPVRFVAQRPLGLDLQFWLTVTGAGFLPVASRYREPPRVPALDTGRYRRAVREGKPDQRRMFTRVDGSAVVWPDGARETVDLLVLATGYRPDVAFLPPDAVGGNGIPEQYKGLSTRYPGLGFVGLEWQRGLLSASLRGVGRDARHVARRLSRG